MAGIELVKGVPYIENMREYLYHRFSKNSKEYEVVRAAVAHHKGEIVMPLGSEAEKLSLQLSAYPDYLEEAEAAVETWENTVTVTPEGELNIPGLNQLPSVDSEKVCKRCVGVYPALCMMVCGKEKDIEK